MTVDNYSSSQAEVVVGLVVTIVVCEPEIRMNFPGDSHCVGGAGDKEVAKTVL